jgi:hypothetical protein
MGSCFRIATQGTEDLNLGRNTFVCQNTAPKSALMLFDPPERAIEAAALKVRLGSGE